MKRFGSIYTFILFLFLGILVSACDFSLDSYKRSVEIKNKYVGEIVFEKTDTSYLFGNSKIINPRGTVICQLPIQEEGLLVQTVNLAEVYLYRKRFPYLIDRRIDF